MFQRQLDFIFIAAEEEERIRAKLKTNALLIEDFRKWLEWLQFNDMLVSLRSGWTIFIIIIIII